MPFFRKKLRSNVILIGLILFHFLLISFQVPIGGGKNIFERAVFSVFSPLQHSLVFAANKISGFWKNYFLLIRLQKKNMELEREIGSLRQENNQLRIALQKLKEKEEVEKFLSSIKKSYITTRVIGIDAGNPYKSITIAAGTLDGVKKNMVVLDEYANLVGRVIGPIALKEAKVQLITDNQSGVGVVTKKTNVKGVLSGDGRGSCWLKYIYATRKVETGEEVVTSGMDHIYPSGLKAGAIESITIDDPLFQRIKVKPFFDFDSLNLVVVMHMDAGEKFVGYK